MRTARGWARAVVVATALAALGAAESEAQTTHAVRGAIVDSAGVAVEGAMVVALALPDSVLTRFVNSRGDGRFELTRLAPGAYVIQVTAPGFDVARRPVEIVDGDLDAGTLRLATRAIELGELVVSVDHVPFVVKGDTLDFNADAFATRPNASVEELLARLPGVEVDDDGTIRAQGREIQKVLVDGKEFFGTDPTIATKNLPADAVERVQVYDKESDMAEFTGIADGDEEWTLNLQLREEARRGHFGQARGGLGGGVQPGEVIEAQPVGRARYGVGLNLFRFSPETQLALLGGGNNVNDAGFAWGDFVNFSGQAGGLRGGGGGRGGGLDIGGGRNDGFTETLSAGLNANHEFGDDRWLRTSYFFTDLDNTQSELVERRQLLGSSLAALQTSTADQTTANRTHRLNVNAQYALGEGHDLRLRGNLTVGSSAATSRTTERSVDLDGDLQNEGFGLQSVAGDDLRGNAGLTWRKRLSDSGRSLVVNATAGLQEPELAGDLATTTTVVGRDGETRVEEVLQEQSRAGRTLSLSERVSLTQPLGERGVVEVFASHRAVNEDQHNAVFDVDGGARVPNEDLTSGFERAYTYLEGGFRVSRNGERHRFTAGLEVQRSDLEGTILDRDETIGSGFTHLLPSLLWAGQFGESRSVNVRYSARTREPSLTELQPFADNSNPTRTYVGNPDLVPQYTHSLTADYKSFDAFSFENVFVFARLQVTDDDIVQARTIDERALQTVTPVNVDRTWSANGGLTYGRPVRPIGAQIDASYGVGYTRGVEILNAFENESRAWSHSLDLGLENRDKERFELRGGARLGWTNVAYTLNPELDQGYLDRSFYGRGRLHFGDGWTVGSNVDFRLYDEDVFGPGDRDRVLWNASLSTLSLDDRMEISLDAVDLLDQNQAVRITNGASFLQERRADTLGRYLMIRVTYRLGSFVGGGGRGGLRGRK